MEGTTNAVIIERIEGLSRIVEIYAEHANGAIDQVNRKMGSIDEALAGLNLKVGIQNGRVSKLEDSINNDEKKLEGVIVHQRGCPGPSLLEKLTKHIEDDQQRWDGMNKVLVITSSWRAILATIVIMSVSIGLIISKFPLVIEWFQNKVIPMFEIGI
jgi:hypothetical protein